MRKRLEKIIFLSITAASLIFIYAYVSFFTPASRTGSVRVVDVPKGSSFRVVAAGLEHAGVIRDSDSFIFLARLMGAYKIIKAGEYEFNTSMTSREVLDMLVKGKIKNYSVIIPEGYNISEIAAALKGADLITDEEQFIKRAFDKRLVASFGLEGKSLEGYLFPDTYLFTKTMTVDEMIARMVEKFNSVYHSELAEAAGKKGISMKKLVTLASIIEKETGAPDERPLISAVFHNRLKKHIRLQSDPTVIYSIRDFDGNLTRKHLLTKTPYNTYIIYGLPPGPIANPGLDSLRAALDPAKEGFLYFVSKNDGTHYFSKSLKEHNRAVNQYQKRIKLISRRQNAG